MALIMALVVLYQTFHISKKVDREMAVMRSEAKVAKSALAERQEAVLRSLRAWKGAGDEKPVVTPHSEIKIPASRETGPRNVVPLPPRVHPLPLSGDIRHEPDRPEPVGNSGLFDHFEKEVGKFDEEFSAGRRALLGRSNP